MPNIIFNDLTISGSKDDFQCFIDDNYIKKKWNIPYREMKNFEIEKETCRLWFTTAWTPPTKWLEEIKVKYTLKIFLYWRDMDDLPSSGIIEDGQEYNIIEMEDFILACKLLHKHQLENV